MLQFIKVVYSGLSGGAIASLLFGVPFKIAFGAELINSILQCILAKKVYAGEGPMARAVLGFSNRLVNGPNKPVEKLTTEEKNRCLTPISAIGSVLGCLGVAGLNYLALTRKWFSGQALSHTQLLNQWQHGTGMHKLLGGLRLIGHHIENFGPIKWMHQRPLLLFPMAIASGLFWGVLEGTVAEKATQKIKASLAK